MPQAKKKLTTPKTMIDAFDLLQARLTQVQAILVAARDTWIDDQEDFSLPPEYMRGILWAADDLISEARETLDLIDVHEHRATLMAARKAA